ncbi:MAG: isovaleryl-CoA dehydrogenase [Hyphomicrobiaceae bacterium]|jgi:putative acyl-CoA dehydrogenase
MASSFTTHEVTNQSPPFEDNNLFTTDRALREAVAREGGERAIESLTAFGAKCGSREMAGLSRLANEHPPRLKSFDRQGRRLDVVEFHPAYHALMEASCGEGLHAKVWEHLSKPGGKAVPGINVTRGAGFYMAAQMEAGHCCPITMTNACVPTLLLQPDLAAEWLPRILSRNYDPAFRPAVEKIGVTLGMGMTEKQGGTDVRANTTHAAPAKGAGGPGAEYILTGHKWFMSAPMCDAFLVLAQAPKGLSCFLMPRFLPDGSVNAMRFQRLKDKLGNRSNASSEVEFHGAHAWLVGEEGRGVPAIIEMVSLTRLDCALSSAGLMRRAVAEAIHHARHRSVFQKRLVDQQLMAEVLADLALDAEAATALAFRLARCLDNAEDQHARAWLRLMTPVTKYWVCKIAPAVVYEAMECLGGNGYVEDSMLARLYREAPVNAIWEGSGNVMALDVLRVLQREPDAAAMVLEELGVSAGDDAGLKAALARLQALLHAPRDLDQRARALVEGLALLAAGCILRAHAPAAVADAFITTRLSGSFRHTWGQGLERADARAIIDRALPAGA